MKVSGAGSSTPAGGARRTGKSTSAGSGEFRKVLADTVESADGAAGIDAPAALGGVDSLLAIQAAGDATEREQRRRLVRRGEDILDRLEEVRHCLLLGTVPKDKLMQLSEMVRSRREASPDPRLASLLDEIELRAEVELAKLSRGS